MKPIRTLIIILTAITLIACKLSDQVKKNYKIYKVLSPFYEFSIDTTHWKVIVASKELNGAKLYLKSLNHPIQGSIFTQANDYQNTAVISNQMLDNLQLLVPNVELNLTSNLLIDQDSYSLFSLRNMISPEGNKVNGYFYELVEKNSSVAFYFYYDKRFTNDYSGIFEDIISNGVIKIDH